MEAQDTAKNNWLAHDNKDRIDVTPEMSNIVGEFTRHREKREGAKEKK